MIEVGRLETLVADERERIVDFLDGASAACLFHRPEWHAAIEATYGHRTHWFVARDGRRLAALFPVVAVRHPLRGLKLVAMPYQFHAGAPLAADEATGAALAEAAISRARELGARHLEIRGAAAAPYLERAGCIALDSGLVITERALDDLRLDALEHGHRKSIGYAARRGVEIVDASTLEGLRAFRRLYRVEQRRFGTPQAGRRLFDNLDRHLHGRYRLLLARRNARLLGGLLALDDGTTTFVRCTAAPDPEARRLRVGQALYWRAMVEARARGCRRFSFGSSARADRGLVAFKEGWRAETRPVHLYGYALGASPPAPGSYVDGYRLAKAIWRRLPLPLVDWLGQRVTRWIC